MFDSVRDALNEGARQARTAAEEAVPRIKTALADATYWVGYSVSFAAVFSYTVATELAPEVLKAGARDGSQAGKRAAEDFAARGKAPATNDAGVTPESSPGASPEPGLA